MSRKLGQYFLKNTEALQAITDALEITAKDTIIEIGPGHGELTKYLLASSAQKIIAIEKDTFLAQKLLTVIHDSPLRSRATDGQARPALPAGRFMIHEGDALTLLPLLASTLYPKPYTLAGNIPYYITGFLFRTMGELKHKPRHAVFMIQKEVAERICSAPPRINKLAATVQIWAKPTIIMTLPPTDFDPPPKVDSAIISLAVRVKGLAVREFNAYYHMVHILFRQPRKTIINNLTFSLPHLSKEKLLAALAETHITPTNRPQNLSIEKIVALSDILIT